MVTGSGQKRVDREREREKRVEVEGNYYYTFGSVNVNGPL